MWLLIDTYNNLPGTVGTVLSVHRSESAAQRANKAFQRKVRGANGSSSYIPTTIREAARKRGQGQEVVESDLK